MRRRLARCCSGYILQHLAILQAGVLRSARCAIRQSIVAYGETPAYHARGKRALWSPAIESLNGNTVVSRIQERDHARLCTSNYNSRPPSDVGELAVRTLRHWSGRNGHAVSPVQAASRGCDLGPAPKFDPRACGSASSVPHDKLLDAAICSVAGRKLQ